MTRRAKLRRIFELAVEQGLSVNDLLSSIEEFSATGGSGIENYVNAELSKLEDQPTPAFDKAAVEYHLSALNQLLSN